jgi:hypothetical protein
VGLTADLIRAANARDAPVLALDIPAESTPLQERSTTRPSALRQPSRWPFPKRDPAVVMPEDAWGSFI